MRFSFRGDLIRQRPYEMQLKFVGTNAYRQQIKLETYSYCI